MTQVMINVVLLVLIIVYTLVVVFVLAMIALKVVRKEKVHTGWYGALCALIVVPLLLFWVVFAFTAPEPVVVETFQHIP
jgi:amino acid transporter